MLETSTVIAKTIESENPNAQLIREALRDLLAKSRELDVFLEGTHHPYGFIAIKMSSLPGEKALRLHLWPRRNRKRQIPDWPVHKHPWDLKSIILVGCVTNQSFEVLKMDEPDKHQLYDVGYSDGVSILSETGEYVSCTLKSSARYLEGEDYTVLANEYHASHVADNEFASTIVVTSDSDGQRPRVVGQLGYEPEYYYKREECESSNLENMLEQLRESLT